MGASRIRTCVPYEQWPPGDRAAWELNCTPGDPFDDALPKVKLRLTSQEKIRKGYGRWLGFLQLHGWLDPVQAPLRRVTRQRLRAYCRELLAAANAPFTVLGRFSELRTALKVLAPGESLDWVVRPFGPTLYAMLPKTRRVRRPPDSGVLFRWALTLMDQAAAAPLAHASCIQYRDGLLIAMLASRARRLRSMALLRPGHELVRLDGRYRIELTPEQVKTGHSVATTAALRDPGRPELAASVLGISQEIVEQHYNLAGQVEAVRRYSDLLQRRHRALQDQMPGEA